MCRTGSSTTATQDASTPIYTPEAFVGESSLPDEMEDVENCQLGGTKPVFTPTAQRIRRIPVLLAPVTKTVSRSTDFLKVLLGSSLLVFLAYVASPDDEPSIRLAMVGNSMMYYNDLPRVLEAMAKGNLEQNSCLHGNADFSSHLWYGNGMWDKWTTGQARIWEIDDVPVYDYGACSVQQLLFGKDDRLIDRRRRRQQQQQLKEQQQPLHQRALAYIVNASDYTQGDDEYATAVPEDAWEYGLMNDGTNPCLVDKNYNDYTQTLYEMDGRPSWDFVLMNDNTRNPCCTDQRAQSMELLENVYLPWLKQIKAAPIFMVTYGYWASNRDMSGLTDVPTFASLTYNGYLEYAELAEQILPESLKPRIAPVGPAFLLVWEENASLWADLIHNDEIHLSPSGTFLQACVVYATIFGKLPDTSIFDGAEGPDRLWRWARRMAPAEHEYKPYPTRDTAQYLYHIAHRVCILGEMPKSLILYPNSTSVSFTPDDSLYATASDRNGGPHL